MVEEKNNNLGRLFLMAGSNNAKSTRDNKDSQRKPKRKYTKRSVVSNDYNQQPVTIANVIPSQGITQSNINLLAKLLDGKNAPLIVILIIVLFVGYGVFVLSQDMRKDIREDMRSLTSSVKDLSDAVKELKPKIVKQQASNLD